MQERLHMSNHPGTNPEPFTATVAEIEENFIMLDESYCYPEEGGNQGIGDHSMGIGGMQILVRHLEVNSYVIQ